MHLCLQISELDAESPVEGLWLNLLTGSVGSLVNSQKGYVTLTSSGKVLGLTWVLLCGRKFLSLS